MKVKTIMDNCISDIINNNNFDKIYVYGSDNLELERLIYKITSLPIIGGDVDFCNSLFGKYFSGCLNLELSEEIYNDFKLDKNCVLDDIEKLSLTLIYISYKPKKNNEHNKRIYDNIIKNQDVLVGKIKNQIKNIFFHIKEFRECELEEFIKDVHIKDLLVIDNCHNYINKRLIKQIIGLNISFIILSKNELTRLKQKQILKSQSLNIYSNINMKSKLLSIKIKKNTTQKSFNTIEDEKIDDIKIKQLTLKQFNSLRQKYLSKTIHYYGTPKVCFGLFADERLFGAFGLTNDYRNKSPKEIEKPCIYLLSDYSVNQKIKKLSKLVLYCILSEEIKLLTERMINKEVKTIYTNVFTKNMSSIKYRDLFVLQDRKQRQDGTYNLTYYSYMGRWKLREGLELWKQKL